MKKIVITGASGFLGSSLIDILDNTNDPFECFCVYNSSTLKKPSEKFKWIQCDLLNIESMERLISSIEPTHLVHLAWHVPPQQFWNAKENLEWLYTSINLFQAFCRNGGRMFIGAGTLAEYDWNNMLLDEASTPLLPKTLYGQCKKSLHEILVKLRDAHCPEINIVWPRVGYFFGPNEPKEKLISKLVHSIQNNLSMDLASLNFERPYAHVKYFGQAISKLLLNDELDDLTFNMSSAVNYNLKEIVDFIQKNLKKMSTRIHFDAYQSKPLSIIVTNKRLKDSIGFEMPDTFFSDLQVILENGIEKF